METVLMILAITFGLLCLAFWAWMLIDCATHEPAETNHKTTWTIIIVFTQIFGALAYYFVRRPARIAEVGV